jgi:hypothetical protein
MAECEPGPMSGAHGAWRAGPAQRADRPALGSESSGPLSARAGPGSRSECQWGPKPEGPMWRKRPAAAARGCQWASASAPAASGRGVARGKPEMPPARGRPGVTPRPPPLRLASTLRLGSFEFKRRCEPAATGILESSRTYRPCRTPASAQECAHSRAWRKRTLIRLVTVSRVITNKAHCSFFHSNRAPSHPPVTIRQGKCCRLRSYAINRSIALARRSCWHPHVSWRGLASCGGLRAVGSTAPARPEPPSRDSELQATPLRRGYWCSPPAASTA